MLGRRERWLENEIQQRTAELRTTQETLQVMAYSDGLTALPNRRQFNEHLQRNLEESASFALALLDLDRFKQINDEYGHDAGDAVLIQAAKRFCALLQHGDRAYRLGGDEFAILIPSLEASYRMEEFCRQLITELCKPIEFLDNELRVGCSIGIAVRRGGHHSSAGLYKAADSALYEAKRAGRGTFRISSANE
jgi:diguanylate cyclase (GGDEF)-like protein